MHTLRITRACMQCCLQTSGCFQRQRVSELRTCADRQSRMHVVFVMHCIGLVCWPRVATLNVRTLLRTSNTGILWQSWIKSNNNQLIHCVSASALQPAAKRLTQGLRFQTGLVQGWGTALTHLSQVKQHKCLYIKLL